MKRQILRFVLGLTYIVLLTLLFLSQFRAIAVPSNEWSAMLAAVVIGIPWLLVLCLYMRVNSDRHKTDAAVSGKKDAAGQEKSEEKFFTIRTARERFETAILGYGLSKREEEVAWLLYRGYTNRQIGEDLFIAETTVKKHVSHIYEKMQVMGRKEFRHKVDGGQEVCTR